MMKSIFSVDRLESMFDAIFAIAMTILVLNFNLPEGMPLSQLWTSIKTTVLPNLYVYAGSFVILGTHWIAVTVQHTYLKSINRPYVWINIFYLLVVCLIPFSSNMVINYIKNPISVVFFAINLMVAMMGQLVMCYGGQFYKLYNELYNDKVKKAILMRIALSPPFYLAAIIFSYWNTTFAFLLLTVPPLVYLFPGRVDKISNS